MAGQRMARRAILRVLPLPVRQWHAGIPPVGVCLRSRRPRRHHARHLVHAEVLHRRRVPVRSSNLRRSSCRATERLVPVAGASEFIDFMVASDPAIQYRVRLG